MKRLVKLWREMRPDLDRSEGYATSSDRPVAPKPPAGSPVYDLRCRDGSSDDFYRDAAQFSDRVLEEIDQRAGCIIRAYSQFVLDQFNEAPRSLGECGLEFLILGSALSRYAGAAENTPVWATDIARELVWLRRRSPGLKYPADLLRAAITRLFLMPRLNRRAASLLPSVHQLPRIIEWLYATGELDQEAMRLDNWRRFLSSLTRLQAQACCQTAADLFDWFTHAAELAMGRYTAGVSTFLAGEYSHRGCREDQIFCSRDAVVYHLNMVAAEIMNRGLRDQFAATAKRVVLVPTCMRGAHAATCRAHASGSDLTCTGCDADCTVNLVTRRMRMLGARVYLVPHSGGFSRWLARWQGFSEYGVVAAACLLNVLPGGLEMRARRIAAQCVPLDWPGCPQHWARHGISTTLNLDRLVQIVQIAQPGTQP